MLRPRHRIVINGVAMAESAALDILAGEANRDAVLENRRERQLFGGRPVNRPLVRVGEHRRSSLTSALELAMHGEAIRNFEQAAIEPLEAIERHGRPGALGGAAWWHLRHRRGGNPLRPPPPR